MACSSWAATWNRSIFAPVRGDELHADRQAARALRQRQADRRLTGDVEVTRRSRSQRNPPTDRVSRFRASNTATSSKRGEGLRLLEHLPRDGLQPARVDRCREEGRGDGRHRAEAAAHHSLPVDGRACVSYDMREVLEHAGCAHGRGGDLGIDRRAGPGFRPHPHAQRAGPDVQLIGVETAWWRRAVLVADAWPMDRIKEVSVPCRRPIGDGQAPCTEPWTSFSEARSRARSGQGDRACGT